MYVDEAGNRSVAREIDGVPLHGPTLWMRSPWIVTQASFQTFAPSQIAPKW